MSKQITYMNHSKWQKQQQTTQTIMYSATYQAGWASVLRRQT